MQTHSIRQTMRLRRQSIALCAQWRVSHRITQQILQSPAYQRSQHIAMYWALGGEVNLMPLIKKAWSQGKICYLPVINGEVLEFVNYTPATLMQANRFGIPEPAEGGIIEPEGIDLVLVPLLAFDKQHSRIGMGGGYYDKTFSFVLNKGATYTARPYLMGVAHRCQCVHKITPQPWDVMLDNVVFV